MREDSQTSIKKFIYILNILKKEGINVSEIKQTNTVDGKTEYTKLSDIVSSDILEKYNLDGEYKIGARITSVKSEYKGNARLAITEEDRQKIEEFKLFSRTADRAKAIEILEKLQQAGIDTSSIPAMIKNEAGERTFARASDVVDMEILKECNINPAYKLGTKIHYLRQAYKGEYPITEEEKAKITALRIIKEGRTSIKDLITMLESLKQEGIDITKIKHVITVAGQRRYVVLSDIISEEILRKHNWNGDYKIGAKISTAKLAYKGIRNISNNR